MRERKYLNMNPDAFELALLRKGLSQSELASLIKLGPATISAAKNGVRGMRPSNARKIISALEMKLEDLFFVG